jgi:hypothetical protein
MNGRFVWRFLLAIVLVALLVGAGVAVYNMGVTQGLAASGKLVSPAPGGTVSPYPYFYGPFMRPWGFGFGFGILGLIFPILFFFLIFGLVRALFFRGWGWGRGYGRMHGDWPNDVPPAVAEWHRKMHEQEANKGNQPQG